MKAYLFYFITSIFPLIVLGQNKSEQPITHAEYAQQYPQKNHSKIKGWVINGNSTDLKDIIVKYAVVNIGNPIQSTYEIALEQDGSFLIILPEKLPNRQIWLSFGSYAYICLYSDDELVLTFDLNKLKKNAVYFNGEGVTFAGKDGDKNRIMNDYILFNKKYNANFSNKINVLATEDSNYMTILDSLFAFQQKVNQDFYMAYDHTQQTLIDGETNMAYYAKKLNYLYRNAKPVHSINELLIPVYAISNNSHEYLQFLNRYMASVGFKGTKEKFSVTNLAKYYDETLPPTYADLGKLQFDDSDLKEKFQLYELLKPTMRYNWSKDYLNSQMTDLAKKIKAIDSINVKSSIDKENSSLGKSILKTKSNSKLYLNEHKSGKELLTALKSTFKNKLVVIDIWATWCMPCIQAMPFGKKLQLEIHDAGLPIEFVYLCSSSGTDEQKWRNKVLELDQPGTHVFVDSKVITEVMNTFDKTGFPSYILLEPNGAYDYHSILSMQSLSLEKLKKKL
ncbi:hypothetical protein BWD42_13120 [Sphingobacterium sp. CZ-UAM]|uniref:TlpA family protein disulfide reductase n=1 Tax=unclassified Sphingobacterium TaxID=2609468 RepID=UPI000984F7BB|nr:TlpA disulfide reductase family protein [Sphingobacterium sp. CZ-UAM]OOG18197.1 hypothetical protein BWD42_13120 [Sphingobacterium sp. CZ-UAM]